MFQSLQPDPIIQLRRIVGFGGASTRDVLWSSNGSNVVYPCHAVVVAMQVSNGHQRFFIGHTDKVREAVAVSCKNKDCVRGHSLFYHFLNILPLKQ